jgi:SAM-dependent methyltransferase
MTCCNHCVDAESLFSRRAARRDLRRYRRRGPHATTRHLLNMIRQEDVRGGELLDIGGGIGAIQHELLAEGLARAVHVDASTAYLAASEAEAERQGHSERVEYLHGDFVDLVDEIPRCDVVTLDRVVCCYPDVRRLVTASASRARRLYGLSYPREHWGTRTGVSLANLFFRIRGSEFRTYLHPPGEIAAELRRQGFTPVSRARTLLWEAALYRRDGT